MVSECICSDRAARAADSSFLRSACLAPQARAEAILAFDAVWDHFRYSDSSSVSGRVSKYRASSSTFPLWKSWGRSLISLFLSSPRRVGVLPTALLCSCRLCGGRWVGWGLDRVICPVLRGLRGVSMSFVRRSAHKRKLSFLRSCWGRTECEALGRGCGQIGMFPCASNGSQGPWL